MIVRTYCLIPCPVSGHEVLKAMSTTSMLLKRCVIKTWHKVGIRQEIMDQSAGISEPDVVLGFHPRWNISIYRLYSIVLQTKRFPGNIAKGNSIDSVVHSCSCRKRWFIIMDGKRRSPKAEHKVDIPSGHLVTTEKKVGDFKLKPIIKWCPVIRSSIWIARWRRRVGWYGISILVTDLPYNLSSVSIL